MSKKNKALILIIIGALILVLGILFFVFKNDKKVENSKVNVSNQSEISTQELSQKIVFNEYSFYGFTIDLGDEYFSIFVDIENDSDKDLPEKNFTFVLYNKNDKEISRINSTIPPLKSHEAKIVETKTLANVGSVAYYKIEAR